MFLRIVVQCIQLVDCFLLTAEGSLVLLEAFEARSAQMVVGCAMCVVEARDSEAGESFHI
jgi:hypothetical protein